MPKLSNGGWQSNNSKNVSVFSSTAQTLNMPNKITNQQKSLNNKCYKIGSQKDTK
jgi:hypothetical protein